MNKTLQLLACITGTLFLGILPGYYTTSEVLGWHASLNKPFFNPPNYLFGPVWTLLFTLMGITLFRIVKATDQQWRRKAVLLFAIQFILNICWSLIFFKWHQMSLALIEISCLLVAISLMIYHLYPKDKIAALINLPYLAWVSFATILNLGFVLLN